MKKRLQFTLLLSLVVLLGSFTSKTKKNKTEITPAKASFGPLKAAFIGPTRKAFFFTDKKYYRQNVSANRLEKSGVINSGFKGLVNNIDAALLHTNGKAYFFKGSTYYRYNYYTKKVEKTGKIGIDGWKGVPKNVDAVVHAKGKTYFFKGKYYYRYSSTSKKVEKTELISKSWKGVPNNVDAALRHANGAIYFFKGDTYYRYTPSLKRVQRRGRMGDNPWRGLEFTKKYIYKKLKITLTAMKVLKSDKKYKTFDVLLQQTISYKAHGKNVSDASWEGMCSKFIEETQLKRVKLRKQGLNTLIYPEWEPFRSNPNYITKAQINNDLIYPLNTKDLADDNARMWISTNLSGFYLKNGRTPSSHVKITKDVPTKVNVSEILKYLLNPKGIPSNYFNSDGYHYTGADGSSMPFKIANDRSALDGYIEHSSEGVTIRTYYHFELVD